MENEIIIESPNTVDTVINQVLYTGKVRVAGGRQGYAVSGDGRLDTFLSVPGSMGKGTNPEQLFAAGWAACFIGAMRQHAPNMGITIPEEVFVHAEIDLALEDRGFSLQARFNISLPNLPAKEAKILVEAAHQICPYSKATRGNINVQTTILL